MAQKVTQCTIDWYVEKFSGSFVASRVISWCVIEMCAVHRMQSLYTHRNSHTQISLSGNAERANKRSIRWVINCVKLIKDLPHHSHSFDMIDAVWLDEDAKWIKPQANISLSFSQSLSLQKFIPSHQCVRVWECESCESCVCGAFSCLSGAYYCICIRQNTVIFSCHCLHVIIFVSSDKIIIRIGPSVSVLSHSAHSVMLVHVVHTNWSGIRVAVVAVVVAVIVGVTANRRKRFVAKEMRKKCMQ